MAESRPKIPNDEEGLLQMQQDFLAGRIRKSVFDVKSTPSSNSEFRIPSARKSVFSRKREARHSHCSSENKKPPTYEIPEIPVVKDVVEKIVLASSNEPILKSNRESVGLSFPEVFIREKSLHEQQNESLFAQQIKKSKTISDNNIEESRCSSKNINNGSPMESKDIPIEAVKGSIHEENLLKLSAMTDEEIMQEKHNIVAKLDPALISFLKNRKATSKKQVEETIHPERPSSVSEDLDDMTTELKNSKCVNMNVVEKEKLQHWVSPLPPVKRRSDAYYQARFDFQGCLLPADIELPTTQSALYHHGEEPERAGYSINEVLILSRSTVLQQRVLAMNVLSKILEKSRLGIYDYHFKDSFIQSLLNGNLLLMMRHCLDDPNEAVIVAALVAFSHFLSSSFDEICLERCYLWYRGEEQPDLCSDIQLDEADKEQEAEMKDNEVAEIDVVKACLQIDILARIRYVLESIRPEPRAVLAALEILTRMSRHSVEMAESVREYPRLLDVIFQNFLPSDWSCMVRKLDDEGTKCVYGVPVPQVLRLIRTMASWNGFLARRLLSQYPVMEAIVSYVAMDTSALNLPTQESLLLVLNSYHTWRVLLRHGLGVEQFIEFFPCLMKQLMYYQNSVSMEHCKNESNIRYSHQLGTAMILMMESVLRLCCTGGKDVHFFHISGLRQPIEVCICKWTFELQKLTVIPQSAASLVAAAIHFLTTFYSHWTDVQQAIPQLNRICLNSILPLLRSDAMATMMKSFIGCSNLISTREPSPNNLASLPSAWATVKGGDVVPAVSPSSPFQLPSAIFRLLRLWNTKCEPTQGEHFQLSAALVDYLERVGKSNSTLTSNWFTRFETHFLHQLLMLQSELKSVSKNRSTFHDPAMTLMTAATSGNEFIAADCLRHVIFNHEFIQKNISGLEGALENMHISMPAESLLSQTVKELNSVTAFYIRQLFTAEKLVPYDCLSHFTTPKFKLTLRQHQKIPNDWIYLPLVVLYQKYMDNVLPPESSEVVIRSLQAVYVLMSLFPVWFYRIHPAEHYSRLACIFLAGNDLFLDPNISSYFWQVLRNISSTAKPLDFSLPIHGIDDFLDFYEHLLKQYEAVSYGDSLFGTFIMLPLQQKQNVKYRLKFWVEHADTLRIHTVTDEQLPESLDHWLEPVEEDEILLQRYSAVLKSGLIAQQRNPVLWKIAAHHSRKKVEKTQVK